MALGGAALRLFQTFIYVLAFCCSAIILGIYSYFLSILADRNLPIYNWAKAVEGISGAAVLYTIFAIVFTCCLGGVRFFAFLAIVLDVLFVGGFIALAILTRDGSRSCTGIVNTPIGQGPDTSRSGFTAAPGSTQSEITYAVSLGTACTMNKACFAVAIIGVFVFLIAAAVQLWLGRHSQREKRYGPSPSNNYTSGSGPKWFGRRRRGAKTTKDAEAGLPATAAGGLAVPAHDTNRHSHDTAFTGTTAGTTKYETGHQVPVAGGYHTAPNGTGINPYGDSRTAATNY